MRDRVVDTTVRIRFTTNDGDGAPVAPSSAFAASDFRVYKDGSATQKTSTNGITVTSPFDSVVGRHLVEIDTSNDTDDAGFWALGSEYSVEINSAKTVDGVSQSGVIVGEFRLVSGAVELDTATLSSIASIKSTGETTQANMYTRFDTVDSTLGAVQNVIDDIMDLTRLVRSADDQKAIVFAFPDASLDLSPSTVSIDGATAVAVTGAITYVGTQDSKFYYSLAWNAADRPSSEGTARYFFNDGDQYFRYIDLRVEVAALSSVIESQLTSIEDGVDGNAGYLTSLTSSMATLLGRVTAPVYAMWLDLIAMITGSGVNPKFTTAAVSNAPSGGGGSGAESDLMVSTTIDALTSQTVFTLVDGSPDNDAYNDQLVVITDADTSTQKSRGIVSDYVASTKTITLRGAPGFTIAAGDAVAIIAIGSDVSSTQLAGAVSSAIATASIPVTVTGIPTFLRVGDARTVANGGAISVRLYSADDDSLLFGLGTQLFEDATITFSLRRPGNDGTEGAEEAVIPCTWVASGGDGYVLIAYEGDALDGCDAMDKVKEKACHRWGIKFQWGSDDPITPVYGNVSVLRKIVSTQ